MLETISEIFCEAYKRNWITARDGNASIRHHDRDHFYITPSGVRKQTLQPEQFKKLDLQGNPLTYTDISAQLKPSGELPLHLGLQRKIVGDVRVVLHLHPTYCVAAMHRGIDLYDLPKEFPELSRYTRVAHNVRDVPPISQELADHCHHQLELDPFTGNIKYDIVGLKGHGVVAVDTTPWRAMEHIERIEHICKIVLASGV